MIKGPKIQSLQIFPLQLNLLEDVIENCEEDTNQILQQVLEQLKSPIKLIKQEQVEEKQIEETPTQKQNKKYEQEFEESIKYLNNLKNNEKDWKLTKSNKNTKGYIKKGEKNLILAKGEAIINAPIQRILDFLQDIKKVKFLSPGTIQDNVIQIVNNDIVVRINISHAPCVDDRTSCFMFGTIQNNYNEYQVISKSVNDCLSFKIKKGQTLCSIEQSWYLSAINQFQSKLILISGIDPAGNIPSFMKNMINKTRGYDWVLIVKNYCEKQEKKLNQLKKTYKKNK